MMTTKQCIPVLRALADESRLRLVQTLARGGLPVSALASRAGLAEYNASRHLRVLRETGLVDAQRQGQRIRYRIRDELLVADESGPRLELGCCSFHLEP